MSKRQFEFEMRCGSHLFKGKASPLRNGESVSACLVAIETLQALREQHPEWMASDSLTIEVRPITPASVN
jgi:hypothetical protein